MNATAEPIAPPATIRRQRSKPMCSIGAACSLVDKNPDQVLSLIEEGQLPWAWDVSSNPRRSRRKEIRILPAAVAAYMTGRECALTWEGVLDVLLPHDEPTLVTKDITRALNVSSTLVFSLVKQKELRPCSTWQTGPGHSARFPRQCFVDFLERRRWP